MTGNVSGAAGTISIPLSEIDASKTCESSTDVPIEYEVASDNFVFLAIPKDSIIVGSATSASGHANSLCIAGGICSDSSPIASSCSCDTGTVSLLL